jgi:16S rRNA (guanine1207-N2)-methyltransferase
MAWQAIGMDPAPNEASGIAPRGSAAERSGHYFDESPSVPSRRRSVQLALPDLSLRLTTDSGMFSPERIDTGTKLLLLEGPPPPVTGHLLDLGCGYGPIAAVLAARSPCATVWAVDVNERARELCAENTAAFGNVTVAAPQDVPSDVWFDAIWSNPPIRIGKPALHSLLATWLARLQPSGVAELVVQRHLGADSLAGWLEAQGYNVRRLASRQAYRIMEVAARAPRWPQ